MGISTDKQRTPHIRCLKRGVLLCPRIKAVQSRANPDIQEREAQLKQLGLAVGYAFEDHNRGFRELGLDVAIDSKGRPWILEVNTRPQFYPLKNMSSHKLYRRMVNIGKQYGRTK